MKVIVAHNTYRIRGGEDQVFDDEVRLLEQHGHEVETFVRHNTEFSGLETLRVAAGSVWNRSIAKDMEAMAARFGADVVHVHNWLPQLSPSVFSGARAGGAAVVQTLHNYRYTCPSGVLYRDGAVCEDCVGRTVALPAVRHRCYRDSTLATASVVSSLTYNKMRHTIDRDVDALIVLSEFARTKMIESGMPADRLHLKPNFVDPDPGEGAGSSGYVLYLGRLVDNKGVLTLLDAWKRMPDAPLLKIAGAGVLADDVARAAGAANIEYVGLVDGTQAALLLADAACTIVPSENYEGFPKTIAESFAAGTPVVASEIGSLAEIIADGVTGFLTRPGDAASIVDVMSKQATREQLAAMRKATRNEYLTKYTADANHATLMKIYESAIARRDAA